MKRNKKINTISNERIASVIQSNRFKIGSFPSNSNNLPNSASLTQQKCKCEEEPTIK